MILVSMFQRARNPIVVFFVLFCSDVGVENPKWPPKSHKIHVSNDS